MNRWVRGLCWTVVAALAGTAVAAAAQEGEAAAQTRPMRIGVVRVQDVFRDYQYAKDQESKIKGEFDKEKTAIENVKKQIEEKSQRLRNDPLIRPNSRNWKLEMLEIERLKVELEDLQGKFNKEIRKRMAEFYRSIYEHFRGVVQAVGDQYQYDLIITAPSPDLSKEGEELDNPEAIRTEILLRRVQYIGTRQGVDITQFVVDQMNKRYAAMKQNNEVNPK